MRDELKANVSADVAVVTMGGPETARQFCERQHLPFTCLSDPSRASYRAYGLRRGGLMDLFGPASLAAGLRAAVHGHLVGVPVGDAYQLGGTFLISLDGTVRYARYPGHAGDHPSAAELKQAISANAD